MLKGAVLLGHAKTPVPKVVVVEKVKKNKIISLLIIGFKDVKGNFKL